MSSKIFRAMTETDLYLKGLRNFEGETKTNTLLNPVPIRFNPLSKNQKNGGGKREGKHPLAPGETYFL